MKEQTAQQIKGMLSSGLLCDGATDGLQAAAVALEAGDLGECIALILRALRAEVLAGHTQGMEAARVKRDAGDCSKIAATLATERARVQKADSQRRTRPLVLAALENARQGWDVKSTELVELVWKDFIDGKMSLPPGYSTKQRPTKKEFRSNLNETLRLSGLENSIKRGRPKKITE